MWWPSVIGWTHAAQNDPRHISNLHSFKDMLLALSPGSRKKYVKLYIEAETKWTIFCRKKKSSAFLLIKMFGFRFSFSRKSVRTQTSVTQHWFRTSGSGLAPNRRQASHYTKHAINAPSSLTYVRHRAAGLNDTWVCASTVAIHADVYYIHI